MKPMQKFGLRHNTLFPAHCFSTIFGAYTSRDKSRDKSVGGHSPELPGSRNEPKRSCVVLAISPDR